MGLLAVLSDLSFLSDVLEIIGLFFEATFDVLGQFWGLAEGADDVLHVVRLATDQASKVKNNTLSLITLTEDGDVGVLDSRQLLLISLPLALKLLSNLLLEDQSLESIVTLLLGAREAGGKTSGIILLLINKTSETSVLTLVVLNLDLEILSLFCELLSKGLEFEELGLSVKSKG